MKNVIVLYHDDAELQGYAYCVYTHQRLFSMRRKGVPMDNGILRVGDTAPAWELTDSAGVVYTLQGVQAQRPAIVTFLRHFG
ncbi:MAG: hypothetical protein RLY87_560 [Chloroflexota bacterium]